MRCARCGNENPEGNRFCGMCGATLLSAPPAAVSVATQAAATQTTALPSPAAAAPAPTRNPPAPRPSAPNDAPVVSGPSFLGLNDPPPRKRASLSIDPHSAPSSRNLDYLLEDDEEPRHGGGGKIILILLALALAVGFGYLRWKNQGLGWLGSTKSKPTAAAQDSDGTDTTTTAPPAATSTSAPATPAVTQPAKDSAPPVVSPAAGVATTNSAPTTTPATTPASTAPATAPGADSAAASGATTPPADSSVAPTPTTTEAPPAAPITTPVPTPKPKAAAEPPPKPPAAIKPVKASDPVSEAQKYIYGRGVTQDCERGMRLLRPAAAQANPKAMIEMGALYSAGLCTPHDLPTAYRWFALALRKDPDNESVQTDLQKLWGEMTQPERQLAIKLSQ